MPPVDQQVRAIRLILLMVEETVAEISSYHRRVKAETLRIIDITEDSYIPAPFCLPALAWSPLSR